MLELIFGGGKIVRAEAANTGLIIRSPTDNRQFRVCYMYAVYTTQVACVGFIGEMLDDGDHSLRRVGSSSLAAEFAGEPRSHYEQAIRLGLLTVNGRKIDLDYKLQNSDLICNRQVRGLIGLRFLPSPLGMCSCAVCASCCLFLFLSCIEGKALFVVPGEVAE